MVRFAVALEGIETVREFQNLPKNIRLNAVRAINRVAATQRTRAARLIQGQINVPARFVSPSSGNLTVSQKATKTRMEGRITARGRATSLARFARPGSKFNKAGVTVEVKPGQAVFLRRAFLVRLPGLGGSTELGKFNAGLAIRLRPGERLSNKTKEVQLSKGLYLLYGPSVQQVFLDNLGSGVAADIDEETADKLQDEFLRLMAL